MSLKDLLTAHADNFRQKTGVTNKLTIAEMTRLIGDLSWNKQNMLIGTSDEYRKTTGSGWMTVTSANTTYTSLTNNHAGDRYTYAATITNLSNVPVRLVLYSYAGDTKNLVFLGPAIPANSKDVKTYITLTTISSTNRLRYNVESIDGKAPEGTTIQIKDERLYPGTEPGVWTPNPADKVGGGN
ncbi:hypothetical protein [Limosilactobacillus sp.]|uniref:hypothetical protein n=1 Tax=Limosilactobacillus sp. TaxID=2773925 RepID=UPI003F032723